MSSSRFKILAVLGALIILTDCTQKSEDVQIHYLETPSEGPSGESSLLTGPDDQLLLSWIETDEQGLSRLLVSKLENDKWQEPDQVAEGSDWFVNWADFPNLSFVGKDMLVAHFLKKSSPDTYAYDVNLSISQDGGKSWNKPFVPHSDGTASEHGFVSKIQVSDSTFMATWLDGREYAYAKVDSSKVEKMTLRSAIIDRNGALLNEFLIDERVCDCCQTDMAMTTDGPMVVFRDRSDKEIRDISFSRFIQGAWSTPKAVYNDEWEIFGCPVNGPAVASQNDKVAISWFALNNEIPEVKLSFFNNSTKTFDQPYLIDQIDPLGRVDIAWISQDKVVVSWMDKHDEAALIRIQTISTNGNFGNIITVEETSLERASGFPRIAVHDNKLYVTWTHFEESTDIKIAYLNISDL